MYAGTINQLIGNRKGNRGDDPRSLPRPRRPGDRMKRRDFIAGLGSAAVGPIAARAQPRERMRRIGVLMSYDENDPEAKARLSAFTQALADLGWADGRNVRMDLHWGG